MKKPLLMFCLATVLLSASMARGASGYDGAALQRDCGAAIKQYESNNGPRSTEEQLAATRCGSYVWGSFTVLRSIQLGKAPSRLLCAPSPVKQEQVVRIVKKWLDENPSKLHLPAEFATVVSLREAFPCRKKVKAPAGQAF